MARRRSRSKTDRLLLQDVAELIQTALPNRAAFGDPISRDRESRGFDAAGANAPGLLGPDQAAVLQHLEMLHHRRERDLERLGEARYGDRAPAELLENGAPGGVAEGMKDHVDAGLRG